MGDVRELLGLGKGASEMKFEQCRSLTGVGDGFLDDFGGAEDEEALLGARDCGVEELACSEGAVGFFG